MPSPVVAAIRPAIGALRTTLGDASLRRLLVAWFTIMAGKWALLVTTLVIAYEQGGPLAVGILGLARYLTPAIFAPLAGLPTARWPMEVVLRGTNLVRTLAAIATVIVVATDAPFALLALVVAVEAGTGSFTRPLHMALLPAVARTPDQLIAANVSSSAAEGLGTFVGPALAGLLLVATGPVGAILSVVAIYAFGVAAIAPLHVPEVGRPRSATVGVRAAFGHVASGIRAAAALPGPRLIIACLGMQTLVRGLLTVLLVVASIELLGIGEPGSVYEMPRHVLAIGRGDPQMPSDRLESMPREIARGEVVAAHGVEGVDQLAPRRHEAHAPVVVGVADNRAGAHPPARGTYAESRSGDAAQR